MHLKITTGFLKKSNKQATRSTTPELSIAETDDNVYSPKTPSSIFARSKIAIPVSNKKALIALAKAFTFKKLKSSESASGSPQYVSPLEAWAKDRFGSLNTNDQARSDELCSSESLNSTPETLASRSDPFDDLSSGDRSRRQRASRHNVRPRLTDIFDISMSGGVQSGSKTLNSKVSDDFSEYLPCITIHICCAKHIRIKEAHLADSIRTVTPNRSRQR